MTLIQIYLYNDDITIHDIIFYERETRKENQHQTVTLLYTKNDLWQRMNSWWLEWIILSILVLLNFTVEDDDDDDPHAI